MPTTPWCHSARYRQSVHPSSSTPHSRSASACSCIVASTSRRSRLSPSSSAAIRSALAWSSDIRQAMPTDMSASRPAALSRGPATKPEVVARRPLRRAAGDGEQRAHARLHAIGADSSQPLIDEDAVGVIEPDDVGDRAQRHQVEQRGQMRLGAMREMTALAQQRPQRAQHVEHHADAGQMLARKRAARLIGIDDPRRLRQPFAGQVMVGDQHVDAERLRRGDTFDARDAVVDGDDHVAGAARPRARRSRVSGRSRTRIGSAPGTRPSLPSRRGRASRPRRRSRRRHRNRRR